jgi:hypothetical protein
MYFLNLPNFHPDQGINTDNYGKTTFLSSADGPFRPDTSDFNYRGFVFPFDKFDFEGSYFFVSETNLAKLFDPYKVEQIREEHRYPVSPAIVADIKAKFYKGYADGQQNFDKEMGSLFFSLAVGEQLKVLVDFMNYCHRNLYFEGFAIPEVLYSLGYIQACLVQGYKTYQNLSKLSVKETVNEPLKKAAPAVPTITPTNKNPEIQKIEIKYPIEEIVKLWQVLIDIHQCKSSMILPFFSTEKQVEALLGEMFYAPKGSAVSLPDHPHRFYELSSDYQPILSLLMHATYKLNHTFTRLKLAPYSTLLKQTFSAFRSIENVTDISGNITKKKDTGILLVKELKSSKYAKNTLKILVKIKDYRINT